MDLIIFFGIPGVNRDQNGWAGRAWNRPLPVRARRIKYSLSLQREIVGITQIIADTALRLAKYFGVTARFWLGLQMDFDLDKASDELAGKIERDVQVMTL